MAISFYHGMPISGSGLQVIHMTRAEYERDKAALDKTDFLIDITDEDSPVISGEDIKGANNWTLASEILESRILGWTVPSNFRVHNYSNDTYFIQTVGRKKLSEFNWTKNSDILFTSATALENAKTGGAFAAYNTVCQISMANGQHITAAGANVNGKTEETIKTFLDDADTYVYYELETPVQHKLWGAEITTQINNDLSDKLNNSAFMWKSQAGIVTDSDGVFGFSVYNGYVPIFSFMTYPSTSAQRRIQISRNPGNGAFYGITNPNFGCEVFTLYAKLN